MKTNASFKDHVNFQSFHNGYFVPETQTSPVVELNEKDTQALSDRSATSIDHSSLRLKNSVDESHTSSFDCSLECTRNATLDESSFINPTPSVTQKINTNILTIVDEENAQSFYKHKIEKTIDNSTVKILSYNIRHFWCLSHSINDGSIYDL